MIFMLRAANSIADSKHADQPWTFAVYSTFSSRFITSSLIVRRPQIGELGKQIDVGPDLVPGPLAVREDGQEGVGRIVGERTAIARKRRGTPLVRGQHVVQQRYHHPPCVL